MQDGFITIHRKILEWEWWGENNTFIVFIYLLLKANHVSKNWQGHTIKRGQHISSIFTIAKNTRLSAQNVKTSIKRLILTKELTKESPSKQWTIYTITRYDDYQLTKELTKGSPRTNQGLTTNNNDNNDNNEKNREGKKINKQKFLDFILLEKKEHEKLINEYGPKITAEYMQRLNEYIGSKGNSYKSHYYTILSWIRKDNISGKQQVRTADINPLDIEL